MLFLIAPLIVESLYNDSIYIVYLSIIVIFLIAIALVRNAFSGTIIELQTDRIKRTGERLSEVSIKYSDIGKIKMRYDGCQVFKKGAYLKLMLLNDRTALTNRDDVLFVPYGIEGYELIVDEIKKQYLKT